MLENHTGQLLMHMITLQIRTKVGLSVCVWQKLKSQLILLFILFLLLSMDIIALFGTIHESYYTILANFYLYLKYFQ